jgi:hypothetical protein
MASGLNQEYFMKVITILITAGLVFAAAGQSTSTDTKKSETRKEPPRTPNSPVIPKEATQLPDGSYRYVDKDGKKWIYRNTPFGVSKAEERPVVQAAQRIEDDPTKSEDLNDSVRFTRPTPFGPKVWTSKKAELDSYEKSIWERDQLPKAPKRDGESAKQD